MPSASLKHPNEKFESLLRRFKRNVEKDDTMKTIREREFYEKPSIKRKRAKAAAIKRRQRSELARQLPKKMY